MKHSFPFLMKTIAAVTLILAAGFAAANYFFPAPWLPAAAIASGTTAYHFIMRLAVGYVVPKTTGYAFDYRHPWFRLRDWESTLYKMLKLKRWKRHLPTYAPGQFSLENQSLHRVIQNMCGAEIVHEIIMILSFLPLLAIPVFGEGAVFCITSLLSALFDSLFVMAQRFNRPRLIRVYEKQEGKRP